MKSKGSLPRVGGVFYDFQIDILDYIYEELGSETTANCQRCSQSMRENCGPSCWFCDLEAMDQLAWDYALPHPSHNANHNN